MFGGGCMRSTVSISRKLPGFFFCWFVGGGGGSRLNDWSDRVKVQIKLGLATYLGNELGLYSRKEYKKTKGRRGPM